MAEHPLTELRYDQLPITAEILRGTRDAGFETCTPIQAQTLPLALKGVDVAGQAQTGTGKTAAFLIACMQLLLEREPLAQHKTGNPRAMILAPTRELAVQIHKDAMVLGAHTGLRFGVVFGGTGYDTQRQMILDGVDVLIGTPGRYIDYFKQGVFNLDGTQVVILDEADRMFDLGFIKDIRYLLRRLPPASDRVNMLFSATLSFRVTDLAYEHMNDPIMVNTSPDEVTVEHVTQSLYHVSKEEKMSLLIGLLRDMEVTRTIVFTNTRRGADSIMDHLNANGFKADALSGDVPQTKRLKLLDRFQSGELPILVATDVAARGLHIPGVTHVFNYDLPQDAEDYVHRIGRTARAGAKGDAVSFACEEFVYSLHEIQQYISAEIPVEQVTDAILVTDYTVPPRRPRKPARPGGRPPPRDGGRGRSSGPRRSSGSSGSGGRNSASQGSGAPSASGTSGSPAGGPPAAGAAPSAAGNGKAAGGGEGDAPKKRRRRPRKRKSEDASPPSTPAPVTEA